MDAQKAQTYAAQWIADWNARNLEAILSHYAENVVFRSPKAERLMQMPEVRGKEALRAYWGRALENNPALHFTLRNAFWNEALRELTIFYLSRSTQGTVYACETMRLNDEDAIVEGIAYYSAQAMAETV